jgi:hypothetical protein
MLGTLPVLSARFHNSGPRFSAEAVLSALSESLVAEQAAHGLTDAEVGELCHKDRTRVLEWRGGTAAMPLLCWLRLLRAWGPSFGWRVLALLGYRLVRLSTPSDPDPVALVRLHLRMLESEEKDLPALASEIEAAGAVIDALRLQLATRGR